MRSRTRIASALVVGMTVCGIPLLPTLVGSAREQVERAERLTRRQFKALPATAVIEMKGQRITKAQILARADAQRKAASAELEANRRLDRAAFEAKRAQFLRQQQAQLSAGNARASAEASRLTASAALQVRTRETIQQEAAQLLIRSRSTRTPAERAQIEQRAAELLRELQRGGR